MKGDKEKLQGGEELKQKPERKEAIEWLKGIGGGDIILSFKGLRQLWEDGWQICLHDDEDDDAPLYIQRDTDLFDLPNQAKVIYVYEDTIGIIKVED